MIKQKCKKNIKIAITGGIGSGKSASLSILAELGYSVVSCDEITANLYKKNRIKKQIKKLFPSAVKGRFFLQVDKKEIARLVFSNKEKREKLNNFLTPIIFEKCLKQANKSRGLVFVEVPLLFENNYQCFFDGVFVVLREKKTRIVSVKNRSSLTEEEVLLRIQSQIDYDNADLSQYTIIENKGDLKQLKKRLKQAVENLNF